MHGFSRSMVVSGSLISGFIKVICEFVKLAGYSLVLLDCSLFLFYWHKASLVEQEEQDFVKSN
jgi:hypothetical protein